jgi:hypothetical protein
MARQLSNAAGSAAGLARAQAYERGNDFMRAVDTYLSLTPADVESLDVLQECWEQVRCCCWCCSKCGGSSQPVYMHVSYEPGS